MLYSFVSKSKDYRRDQGLNALRYEVEHCVSDLMAGNEKGHRVADHGSAKTAATAPPPYA